MKKIFLFSSAFTSIGFILLLGFSTTAHAASAICQVTDATTAKACFDKVNIGEVDNVEVANLITCSGPSNCDFTITVNRPVNIYGTPGNLAGFKRIDNRNYCILKIHNSSNVTVTNLVFDDTLGTHIPDPAGVCMSNIEVNYSSNITFDGIVSKNSQVMGLSLYRPINLTIKNSEISNNGWFGIWADTAESIHIENNVFKDNLSNAIFANFTGTLSNPSVIKNNTFTNNHRQAVFNSCGGNGTEPCPGGQLAITLNTNNTVVSNNTITNGSLDIGSSGIELMGNSQNLTIQRNKIANNTGAGIYLNPGQTNITNLSITENELYNNREGNLLWLPGGVASNNCFSPGCNVNAGAKPVSSTTPPTPVLIPGDINGSGKVDINDYNLLKNNFGKAGVGDINGNGKVDIFDYNSLISNYGK